MEEVNKGSKYKLLCNFASNDEVVLPQISKNTNIDGLLKPGIILFTELSTIVNEIEMDSRSEEVKIDLQSHQALIHKAEFKDLYWDIPTKKKKALQMYFENTLKPKLISRKLKLPVNQIYRDFDKIKQFIEKWSKKRDNDAYIKMKTFNEIKQSIMGIVNSMSNECITIPKISQKLNAEKSHSKKVSSYLISKILKSELGLSYKRVGHRPWEHLAKSIKPEEKIMQSLLEHLTHQTLYWYSWMNLLLVIHLFRTIPGASEELLILLV